MGSEESIIDKPCAFNHYLTVECLQVSYYSAQPGFGNSVIQIELITKKNVKPPSYCNISGKVNMSNDVRSIKLDLFEGVKEIKFVASKSISGSKDKLYGLLKLSKIPKDALYKYKVNLYDYDGEKVGKIHLNLFYSGNQTQREELLKYARSDESKQVIIISRKDEKEKNLQNAHLSVVLRVLDFLRNHGEIVIVERIQTKIIDDYIISVAFKFKFTHEFIKRSNETPLIPAKNRVVSIIIPSLGDDAKYKNVIDDNDQFVIGFEGISLNNVNLSDNTKLKIVVEILSNSSKVLNTMKTNTTVRNISKEFFKFNIDDETNMITIHFSKGSMGLYKKLGICKFSVKYCLNSSESNKVKMNCDIYNSKNEDMVYGQVNLDVECYNSKIINLSRLKEKVYVQFYQGNFGENSKYICKDEGAFKTTLSARCKGTRFSMKYGNQIDLISIDECQMLKYDRKLKRSSYDCSSCVDCVKVWFKIKQNDDLEKKKAEPVVLDISNPF